MTASTILYIFLALIIAAAFSFFQYLFKSENKRKLTYLLFILRFISVFGILLLLINPAVTQKYFEIVKTPLPILVDNSKSIESLQANETALKVYDEIIKNPDIQEKFDLQSFAFGERVEQRDSFDFRDKQTRSEQIAKVLKNRNRNAVYPIVIITDGNQTQGSDYVYSFEQNTKVYPVVLGDTTSVFDLKIDRLNVNKYAFLKNKFPVEVFLNYSGNKSVSANFSIIQGETVIYRQSVTFMSGQKSQVINLLLPAEKTGVQVYKAVLNSSETEKNTYNNIKNFAVEVIDQKTEVAFVSAINHPDIGALKRAIESNSQRKFTLLKPNQVTDLYNYNVLILYQPTSEFSQVFESVKRLGTNTWIITGTQTDFNWLNKNQEVFDFRLSSQKEDYLADFNEQFNAFTLDNIGFENFPPLQHPFGNITIKQNVQNLLDAKIRNVKLEQPILAFYENQNLRQAFLLGENIWKWRLNYFVEHQDFEDFDVFIDKTIQFLATSEKRKSLIVNHESFYNSGDAIEIIAQFFNKNYELDENAMLTLSLVNKTSKQTRNYDLLRSSNAHKVNLDGLDAGEYSFSVKELSSNTTYNGQFEVLDFDIELQFINPDYNRLVQLAAHTGGAVFMPDNTSQLIESLLDNEDYKTIQKEIVKKSPLIDWVWLLVAVASILAIEWFVRKYNGLL